MSSFNCDFGWKLELSFDFNFLCHDEQGRNNKQQEMSHHHLDPHARPPEKIKDLYKRYQKLKGNALLQDAELLDLQRDQASLVRVGDISIDELEKAFTAFDHGKSLISRADLHPIPIFTHEAMPGIIL
jgi:hypothetical protein